MTGRSMRRRWIAAVTMGLAAASATVAQVSMPLPPIVVTPPVPPAKAVAPVVPVPAVPPVSIVEPVSPYIEDRDPIAIVPVEVAPPPTRVVVEPPRMPDVVEPPAIKIVPATPVSLAKPPRPPMAEIIKSGPKPVDSSMAFATAMSDAKAAYAKVRDYSGHMVMQERLQGQLQAEQTAELRMRMMPQSIAVKFIAPSAMVGREIAFVDGRSSNKVRTKAAGTYGPLAYASVSMSDPKAAVNSTHTLADIGIAAILGRIDRALAIEAKLRNPVSIIAADFSFAGKTVTRFEICFDRAHGLRDAARYVVCIDPDSKLPVRFEVYDGPTAGKLEGDLREAISFVNLTFNRGISDAAFDR